MELHRPAMLVVSKYQEHVMKSYLPIYLINTLSESCFCYTNLELS